MISTGNDSEGEHAGQLPGPVVSAEWLMENRDHVVLADVRWSIPDGPKREDFEGGHLPGAIFVDLDADLSGPPGERGRHPLPSPERFADTRNRLGLSDKAVVAYDDSGGAVAARLWWMLDSVGHHVAVLDGGIDAWPAELVSGGSAPTPSQAQAEAIPWPTSRFIEADAMLGEIEAGAVALDARSSERFSGAPNAIDSRAGHMPGSRSMPWQTNLGSDGRFLDAERLRSTFAEAGLEGRAEGQLLASCGSGVTGCHLLLAAAAAGLGKGRLYPGSWSEWSLDPAAPVVTGAS